jgi:ABC-2 type transport system ATP-binding protein
MVAKQAAIRTFGLTKAYGDILSLFNLDLEVSRGEVFGFLGPNGSGKTTTIRLLLDFIRPTSGRAEILGLDTRKHAFDLRRRVGNLPGDFMIYPQLTVDAFFKLCSGGRPGGMERARTLAERFGLDPGRKVGTLSSGNRQKAGLVQSLMHDPELVILDEPTSGLDPLVKEEFYGLVDEEKGRGKTIFLSSHVLPEIERICDRVGIVREGRLIAVEKVDSLKRHKRRRMAVTFAMPVPGAALNWGADGAVEVLASGNDHLELSIPEGSVDGVVKILAGLPVADLVFPEATLEEAFMSLYEGPAPQDPGPQVESRGDAS